MADEEKQPPAQDQKPPEQKPDDVAALKAHNSRVINELNKVKKEKETLASEVEGLKSKMAKFGEVFGLDVKEDPAKTAAQREADKLAQDARHGKIREAVTFGLIESGRKIPRQVAAAIVSGALGEPSISIGDDGNVGGVGEYLTTWLSTIGSPSEGEPRKTAPMPPAKSGGGTVTTKFDGIKTFMELQAMGIAAVMECSEKAPEVYARLRTTFNQGALSPTRTLPPAIRS